MGFFILITFLKTDVEVIIEVVFIGRLNFVLTNGTIKGQSL